MNHNEITMNNNKKAWKFFHKYVNVCSCVMNSFLTASYNLNCLDIVNVITHIIDLI